MKTRRSALVSDRCSAFGSDIGHSFSGKYSTRPACLTACTLFRGKTYIPVLAEEEASDPFVSSVDFTDSAFDGKLSSLDILHATLGSLAERIPAQAAVNDLRGLEGKMRERYYQSWRHILADGWAFERRVRRPPDNEINALISFGNSVLYTVCLSEIYRTQLTPTVSYLHEPGARRFSLALDISEIFKPLLVDRAIFRLINTGQMKPSHFDRGLDSCVLTDAGKRLFLGALEERLGTTIRHRRLGRHVSYRHLMELKPGSGFFFARLRRQLLIEPIWN